MISDKLLTQFLKRYPGAENPMKAFCPYRVCPIGAHVDHQHGKITGFAIDKGIEIVFIPTKNGVVELSSLNFEGKKQFHINSVPEKQNDWADYLRGATIAIGERYELKYGVYALISGGLPIGGLSSSAAVILAYMSALCKANNIHLNQREVVEIAQSAENNYVGISVGKLDQSCEIYSKKEHLLYLDTRTDEYQLIPLNKKMKPFEIAVFFSGVERTLVGSAYNMRVDESKSAAYALLAFANQPYGKFKETRLRDVEESVFEKYKDKLPENWKKRAMHYYSEQNRVEKGVEAWKNGDIDAFGSLSYESGISSIENYQTGSTELKALSEIMAHTEGIYGGRFSGAGFKGCCIALVDPAKKKSIKEQVTKEYLGKFPELEGKFSVHFCKTADGCEF